jgi:hypothetical protein
MNDFAFYFDLGWKHIISKNALDHQLFIITLAAIYLADNWKEILILVTAFTVGHSLTLALSTYNLLQADPVWVEFLIPVTIMVTAVINFFRRNFQPQSYRLQYFLALFFGLIHGLGFANTIRFMLAESQSVTVPLLGFNTGLEAGQVLVVAIVLCLSYLFVNRMGLKRKWWVWSLSAVSLAWSVVLTIKHLPG